MALASFKHVKIKGIITVLPEHCIHIDDEIRFYDNDPKKLERNKGILGLGSRYILPQGLTCLDLCEEAAKRLIKELRINLEEIDGVIVVSETHDYIAPSDACLIQGRLKLPAKCMCFDVGGLSCSGYVHGLLIAHSLIESGVMNKCLLLAGDMNASRSDVRNRNSAMLFSDSGSATIIERSEDTYNSFFDVGTNGDKWDKIIVPASGNRLPIRNDIANIEVTDEKKNVWRLWDVIMKGGDVFQFALRVAPKSMTDLLQYAGKTVEDIDYFPMHQANKQIVSFIQKIANIPIEKTSGVTFEKYANCAAASVVSVICDQLKDKKVNDIMLVTFGIGLSWGTCIVDFGNVVNCGVQFMKTPEKIKTRSEITEYWIKYFKGEK
mgnify:CR=1 FL=1